MQKPTINRHQSLENRLFDSAGKYSTLETNAVGNTLNGSPSNLQNVKPSKSNARFKKLDPEHVIGGMQNPSPERNEIFKVKDAISFDKKVVKPVPYPFQNGNLASEEVSQSSYRIP